MPRNAKSRAGVSRRSLLKKGAAAAVAGGAALVASGPSVTAQAAPQAPAILQGNNTGRRFRAFVRFGTGTSVQRTSMVGVVLYG